MPFLNEIDIKYVYIQTPPCSQTGAPQALFQEARGAGKCQRPCEGHEYGRRRALDMSNEKLLVASLLLVAMPGATSSVLAPC